MKTLSIVSTQMQLLNCIEYLTQNQLYNNHLLLFVLNPSRLPQILELLEIPCNKRVFRKISICSFGKCRIVNFFKSIVFHYYIFYLSYKKEYRYAILGNYRVCFGRWFWALRNDVDKITVDDGTATITWFKVRKEEIKSGKPQIFYINRFLRLIARKNRKMIPQSVKFFSIYYSTIPKYDSLIKNDYHYFQNNIESYPNALSIFIKESVFLGQPLYAHNILSIKRYNEILLKIHELTGKDFVYYPHPEEHDDSWMSDAVKAHFKYIPCSFSFEIFALMEKKPLMIFSFYTSTLPVLRAIKPNFSLFSIKFEEIRNLDCQYSNDLDNIYKYFDSLGIKVLII